MQAFMKFIGCSLNGTGRGSCKRRAPENGLGIPTTIRSSIF